MKKILFVALSLSFSLSLLGQETGMHIEHDATWQQILDKAKKENKFIFLDALCQLVRALQMDGEGSISKTGSWRCYQSILHQRKNRYGKR
jgi:hypothetical protein